MKSTLIFLLIFLAISQAKQGFGPGEQDWGYVDVRPGCHMFWWLYYTEASVENFEDKPLMIWLQGGPGGDSTGYGNFREVGPQFIDESLRNYTWVKEYNVLFIDNPVSVGFSYVDDLLLIPTNNHQIALDLVELLKGFYDAVPSFKSVPLYIAGESYGGKMGIEFVWELHKAIQAGQIESNLKAMLQVDPALAMIDCAVNWPLYLLATGLIDEAQYPVVDREVQYIQQLLYQGNYSLANYQMSQTQALIENLTGGVDFYNIETYSDGDITLSAKNRARYALRLGDSIHSLPGSIDPAIDDFMRSKVAPVLNISTVFNEQNNQGDPIMKALFHDFIRPATEIVENVLRETNLTVYVLAGQLDLIANNIGTHKWVQRLKFPGDNEWRSSTRDLLIVDGEVEGYYKKTDRLGLFWIDRAGHMVPMDNPNAVLKVLDYLTSN